MNASGAIRRLAGRSTTRRMVLGGLAGGVAAVIGPRPGKDAAAAPATPAASAAADALPSWNDGAAKEALLGFVAAATDAGGPGYVPPDERIATFDQDGTLWVEHPIYSQAVFAIDRIAAMAPEHPDWAGKEPFATILSGNQQAIARFTEQDWERIVGETHAGMSVDSFLQTAADWTATAKDPRFGRLYTELVYQPMLEAMALLHGAGFQTYIVSGGGQEFIRSYAERVYGIPPEHVIGTTLATKYQLAADGAPALIKQPTLQLNDNNGGKPESINLFIGRRPAAAFGNSTGDQQMLEWAGAGKRAHLEMLVLHDDAAREYAYGPADGLPDTSVGTFSDSLLTEATGKGWTVVSMKRDWNRVFPWSAVAS